MNDLYGQNRSRGRSLVLRDLMIFVLAAGVSFGLAAGAVDPWRNFPNQFERPTGVAVVMLAVWLCVPLIRGLIAVVRGRSSLLAKVWPIAWRSVAVAGLCTLLAHESALLQLDWDRMREEVRFPPINTQPLVGRLNTLPILGALAIFGISAALAPVRPRPIREAKGRWMIVLASAIAGALVMALWWFVVPYLVLIAIDGVSMALASRSGQILPDVFMRSAPTLNARLNRAGWETLVGSLAILVTGALLARDLRRDLSAEAATAMRMVPRVGLIVATAFAGWWLLHVTVPLVHPNLYGGLEFVMEPIDSWLIAGGFATLAIGLAARSVAPSVEGPVIAGGWRRAAKVAWFAVLGLLGLVSAAATMLWVQPSVAASPWLKFLGDFRARLSLVLPIEWLAMPSAYFGLLARVLALLSLVVLVLRANAPGRIRITAPLDAVVASRSRIVWFFWGAVGLSVVCLAAMPAFFLCGLALMRIRLHSLEWLGWNLDP